MRNFIYKILVILIFFTNISSYNVMALDVPQLAAEGVVLMDYLTGDVLFSKNPDTPFEPASTTKVMTALITLENTKLDDKVTIGVNPPLADGSSIGIAEGQVYTIKELLLGLLLESGNDCAEALAEHISGSTEEFSKLMTNKAKELGAKNTTFKNPSGLHEPGHITTAYDLSLIMRAAVENPAFVEISKTPYYFFPNNLNYDGSEKWAYNRNHCINDLTPYYYEFAFCGKTGYTPEANHTYTSAAKKGDQILIASFLNAVDKDTQFSSVGPLFQYGFDNFETIKIIEKDSVISEYILNDKITIPLLAEKDVFYLKNKSSEKPSLNIKYPDKDLSKESITKGQVLFKGAVLLDDKKYTEINLLSGETREYSSKIVVEESIDSLITKIKKYIIPVIISLIVVLFIIRVIIVNNRRKRRMKKRFNSIKRKMK